MTKSIEEIIAEADTPAKVWALVLELSADGNGYTDSTYLKNVKGWAAVAIDMHAAEASA